MLAHLGLGHVLVLVLCVSPVYVPTCVLCLYRPLHVACDITLRPAGCHFSIHAPPATPLRANLQMNLEKIMRMLVNGDFI